VKLIDQSEHIRREVIVWLFPTDFKVLLPILSPGPAVVINEAGIARRELSGSSIDIAQVAQAFDVGVASGCIIQSGLTIELHCDVQRLYERVRIIKHGFML